MRLENLTIPENFDFDSVSGLTIECRQKLKKYAPRTIAQASRISGVSPADVSVLLVYLEQLKFLNPDLFSKLNTEKSIDGE